MQLSFIVSGGLGLRNRSSVYAVIVLLTALCLLFIITVSCSAQSAPSFQSVSGEFARNWIDSYKAQNPQPVQESRGNGSDLWNWGNAPRGSRIDNGKLLTDPNYLRPQLNLSSNWLGDTYTDPNSGNAVYSGLAPFDLVNALSNGLAQQTDTKQNGPWTRL